MTSATRSEPFQIVETLRESEESRVYRAVRRADGRRVVLKVLGPARLEGQTQLEAELRIAGPLDTPAVARPLNLDRLDGAPALVFEDCEGVALDRLLDRPFPISRFLPAALAMARGLDEIHARGVVHRDLRPANFLLEEGAGGHRVKVTGFSLASLAPREDVRGELPGRMGETLAYLSPEQTGRVGRPVDQRSDLYTLGAVFYEMLTGRPPFTTPDPVAAVHALLARLPESPSALAPHVPDALSAVVMKLLAKDPDARYQSAGGLAEDLARAWDAWKIDGTVGPFALATRDVPERLQISGRLYGRAAPLAALEDAFHRVASGGAPEMALMEGPAGIGKSAVARALETRVLALGGRFVRGKFDRRRSDVPYSAVTEALGELVLRLLAEPEDELRTLRRRLSTALGSHAPLMIEVVPALRLLLGDGEARAPAASPDGTSHFALACERMMEALAAGGKPLVVFLDDLQWADAASVRLLERLVGRPESRHLLVVGAARAIDPDSAPELFATLGRLEQRGVPLSRLALAPLSVAEVAGLLSDVLRRPGDEVTPLAAIIHRRSEGNPFFVLQLLSALWRDGLLNVDRGQARWQWDLGGVAVYGLHDDLVDIMLRRLGELPVATRDLLRRLACLGSSAAVATLAAVCGDSEARVHVAALPAMRAELLVHGQDGFRFTHDRVREAAYELTSEPDRAELHVEVGRRLLTLVGPDAVGAPARAVFDVVHQLNRAVAKLESDAERLRLADLDLEACRRATRAGAFSEALEYAVAGTRALAALTSPVSSGPLGLALEVERARAELLSGNPVAAEQRLRALLTVPAPPLTHAPVRALLQMAHLAAGDIMAAVEDEVAGLAACGETIPRHPTDEDVRAEHMALLRRLNGRSPEILLELPELIDPRVLAALELSNPSFFVDSRLWFIHAARCLSLTLDHGVGDQAIFWCSTYGFALCAFLGRYTEARRFALTARALLEKRGTPAWRPRMEYAAACALLWTDPIDRAAAGYATAYLAGRETGDFITAGFGAAQLSLLALFGRDPLAQVQSDLLARLAFVEKAGMGDARDVILIARQVARCLGGQTRAIDSLSDGDFDEIAFAATMTPMRMATLVCAYQTARLQLSYLAGDFPGALAAIERAAPGLPAVAGLVTSAVHTFFHALTLSELLPDAPVARRGAWMAELEALARRLQHWASINPSSFAHLSLLVHAELARVRGQSFEAVRFYEQSLEQARTNRFLQIEALAGELAGRYYRSAGLTQLADLRFDEASDAYARWGAHGKARALDVLAGRADRGPRVPPLPRTEQIDLLSVVRASQAISREVVLERLPHALLEVALAGSGATRGCLLLAEPGALVLAAEAGVTGSHTVVRELHESAFESRLIPRSVVQWVWRTGETLLLTDAATGRFSDDEYVQTHGTRSLLCLPILRQGEVTGILYLENDVLSAAFTHERLTLLEQLAAQAAISFENARLYRQAEEAIGLRDEFLSIASHELNTPTSALLLALRALVDGASETSPDAGSLARLAQLSERQGRRLARLVRELLEVGRIERNQFTLRREPIELGPLVREVLASLEEELRRAHCPVRVVESEPAPGHWDPLRIEQLVYNLLSNAIKFGAGHPIEISVVRTATGARLSVADHGAGIEPTWQPRIFERFSRSPHGPQVGGLGLGLYISRRIVDAHGGDIRVNSRPGFGATFTVDLPNAAADEPAS